MACPTFFLYVSYKSMTCKHSGAFLPVRKIFFRPPEGCRKAAEGFFSYSAVIAKRPNLNILKSKNGHN
jgi:hypothetical protein